MRKKHKDAELTEEAYIVVCGCLKSPQCCHVILDNETSNVTYNLTNVIESVDFLFKLFFVLKLRYPHACSHIWGFLQKYIYKMETARRHVGTRPINEFITNIEKIR